MSVSPNVELLQEQRKQQKIGQQKFQVYQDLSAYFEQQKNPKIFMFFILLIELSLKRNSNKIFFNILQMSYKYNVCEKTIKLWIKELEKLKLLRFSYKNKQLFFVQLLDYKQSKLYKSLMIQQANPNQELPTRFYKNVAQIMRQVSKNFIGKSFLLEGESQESYRLVLPSKQHNIVQGYNAILLEFQNTKDTQFSTYRNYEYLTHKPLPSLNNPYHLKIIKANLKKSLELLSS